MSQLPSEGSKPARPENQRQGTTNKTFVNPESKGDSPPQSDSGNDEKGGSLNDEGGEEKPAVQDEKAEQTQASPTISSRRLHDIFVLLGIFIMLVWPWLFWGGVRHLRGVKMKNNLAKIVKKHPATTAFFVSLVGNLVCLVVDIFFSLSVIRFAQEWVAEKPKVSVFHVSLFGAFRNQNFPWTMKDLGVLLKKNKWLPVTLVGVCIGAFQFVPSGTTSLLLPVPFDRTEPLVGTELDFSSTAADCIAWLGSNPFLNDCDWQNFNGTRYTSCLGQNQLVDVLAAGRSSILALIPNNTESLSLSQLGAKDGMRILGPLRGILPIGPNGAPSFDTLKPSPFTNPDIAEAMLAYNYTLDYQGLSTNISCVFADSSPIVFGPVANDTQWMLQYNGTCPEGTTDFLPERGVLTVPNPRARNGMGWWACGAPPVEEGLPSYFLYLKGRSGYTDFITNITCHVSPIQPAVYPVTYRSEARIFKSEPSISNATNAYLGLIEEALVGVTGVIRESQNVEANLVTESIITFGVKAFDLPHRGRDDGYLPLFEAMIQGMLDYEASYSRLIWSTNLDAPDSCKRDVTGHVNYTVIGWDAKLEHIGFLLPMTLVNIASLLIILSAIILTKGDVPHRLNPTDPRPLLEAGIPEGGENDDEWDKTVSFMPSAAVGAAADRFKLGAPPIGDVAGEFGFGSLATVIPSP